MKVVGALLSVCVNPSCNQPINQLIGQCQCTHYTVPAPVAFAYRWRAIHKVTNTLSLKPPPPPPPHLPNPNRASAPFHIKPRHNPNDSTLSCNIIAIFSLYLTFHYVWGAGENIWICGGWNHQQQVKYHVMGRFIICTPRRILWGWWCQQKWDGREIWHAGGKL